MLLLKSFIKKNPLIAFFVLAYLISWLLWTPLLGANEDSPRILMLFLLLGGLGPLLAGLIVSIINGETKKFKEINLKWRVSYLWYLFVIFLPILMYLFAYLVFVLMGGEHSNLADTPPIFVYPILLLYVILLGGGLEEPGWRGFALPRLQKIYTPFVASLILGVIWIFWHLPLFFSEISSQVGIPFVWYFLTAIALSCIFTMVFNKSGNNAFLAIILHGGVNAPTAWYPVYASISTSVGTINAYIPLTIVTWLTFFILLIIWKQKFFQKLN